MKDEREALAGENLHEECGVFGMYDLDGNPVASEIYYGLFALQHRGQESCGIAVSDTKGPKGKVYVMRRLPRRSWKGFMGISELDMSVIPQLVAAL